MIAQPQGRVVVAPSLLAADFGRLREEAASVAQAGGDWLHFDVMDGHFVPNLSFGPQVLTALRPHCALPFDVHLMITPADPFIAAFAEAGADHISIHPEAGPHPHRTLQLIRSLGKKAGVVLSPGTPAESIAWLLELADIVLVMTVNPGFGGQRFLSSQLPKIAAMRRMIDTTARPVGRPIALAVDGGITPETAAEVLAAGADTLIAGTAVFGAPDRAAAIAALRGNARRGSTLSGAASTSDAARGDAPVGGPHPRDAPLGGAPLGGAPLGGAALGGARLDDGANVPINDVPLSDVVLGDVPVTDVILGGGLPGNVGLGDVLLGDVTDVPVSDVALGGGLPGDVPLSDVSPGDGLLSNVPLGNVPPGSASPGDAPPGNSPPDDAPPGDTPAGDATRGNRLRGGAG